MFVSLSGHAQPAIIGPMARRTGPSPRITEFAALIASHPMLISAICQRVADILPELVAALEAEERRAAAPAPPAEAPTMMTYRERLALKNGPPPRG